MCSIISARAPKFIPQEVHLNCITCVWEPGLATGRVCTLPCSLSSASVENFTPQVLCALNTNQVS